MELDTLLNYLKMKVFIFMLVVIMLKSVVMPMD